MGALHRETFPKNPAQPHAFPYPAWRVQDSNLDRLPFAPSPARFRCWQWSWLGLDPASMPIS